MSELDSDVGLSALELDHALATWLAALPTRYCACGAPTGSPALDQCEVCENKREEEQ